MKRLFKVGFCSTVVLLTLFIGVHSASAAIVDHADVAGYKTFQDQNTGRVWLDLNNFFGKTFNEMADAATAAGFTVANETDVQGLLNTLPNPAGNWASYTAIMGMAPNRALIWGAYYYDSASHSWAYAFDTDSTWQYQYHAWDNVTVPNAGGPYADLNIWAYQTGAPVPLPSAVLLLGPGLVGLAAARRRFKK